MKFSIRELLALTFLVVLGIHAWNTFYEVRIGRDRLTQLQVEIKLLEVQVRLDQPAMHQAMLHTRDEFDSLRVVRDRSIETFESIREKYSSMEPPKAGVLAIRGIPSLRMDEGPAPVVFRLFVPAERSIWLKYGVHEVDQSTHRSRGSDQESDLLTDSPFSDSGPFERKLPAGDFVLAIETGSVKDGSLPLLIKLGDEVLLRSTFVSPQVTHGGSSHISALTQTNYGRQRPLPWLLTTNMNLHDPVTGTSPGKSHGFSIWFSDHSSSFASFPGE